jgi:SAM-dependent methyltransferase
MTIRYRALALAVLLALIVVGAGAAQAPVGPPAPAAPPAPAGPYQPRVGQPGKDVVWVPTPPELVQTMLDLAKVTKDDYVMDLGSGDGRNIVAAAQRGARGVGVEFNPQLVEVSNRIAREKGVADKATFIQGDMYEADISKATVMAIYLLPANMDKLLPKFQALTPGSRIVANTFGFSDWDPDARDTVKESACSDWCEALLWIVPARVAGHWRLGDGMGTLALTQLNQVVYGSLTAGSTAAPLSKARMRGYDIAFTIGDRVYSGRVSGSSMQGTVSGRDGTRDWRATRVER